MTKNAPTPSNRLGNLLQEAREKREMTLGDVAGITHVRKEYLQAIDEGRWDDLPENVYTRNFLRLYASAVGVEEAAVLNLYGEERYGQRAPKQRGNRQNNRQDARASHARGYQSQQQSSSYGQPSNPEPAAPRRSGGRWVAPFLLTVILAGLGIFAWQNMAYTDILSQANTWYQQQTWLPWLADDAPADDALVDDTFVDDDASDVLTNADASVTGGDRDIHNAVSTSTLNTSNAATSNQSTVDNVATNTNDSSVTSTVANDADTTTSNNSATSDNANNLSSDSTQAAFAQTDTSDAAAGANNTNNLNAPTSGDMPPPSDQVLLSIVTEPEGANVSLDGFVLSSRTPIVAALVRPGRSRVLSLELDGYVSSEQAIDLTLNRDIYHAFVPLASQDNQASAGLEGEIVEDTAEDGTGAVEGEVLLTPDNAAEDSDSTAEGADTTADTVDDVAASPDASDATDSNTATGDANTLVLQADEAVWLEVYTGSARGEGERLAYRMLQAGESLSVPTPAFVHAGNSQALQVSRAGQALGAHGEDVTGKLYP